MYNSLLHGQVVGEREELIPERIVHVDALRTHETSEIGVLLEAVHAAVLGSHLSTSLCRCLMSCSVQLRLAAFEC